MPPLPSPHLAGITLRSARPDDADALRRLAALDSRPLPSGRLLLAEEDGVLRAALSLETGAAIADPFARTDHLCALLRRHAERRTASAGWSVGLRAHLPRVAARTG
jgi:hypothetical protein